MLYDMACMWNSKNIINLISKQKKKQTHRYRSQAMAAIGEREMGKGRIGLQENRVIMRIFMCMKLLKILKH